jgi:hypothetical protein
MSGKLVMECVIETKAITILDFLKGPTREPARRAFNTVVGRFWLYITV